MEAAKIKECESKMVKKKKATNKNSSRGALSGSGLDADSEKRLLITHDLQESRRARRWHRREEGGEGGVGMRANRWSPRCSLCSPLIRPSVMKSKA